MKARGYFLVSMNSNGTGGAALPTADQTTALSPSGTTGTIFLTTTTAATTPDSAAVIDKLGYGGSNSPEGTAAPYDGTNATPGSLNRTSFVDTDNNVADFSFSTAVTPQNSGATTPDPDPEPTEATIAEIQGPGSASPLVGTEVITQGVVTAVDAPRPRRATPRSSRPTVAPPRTAARARRVFIASKGNLDMAYPALIMANAALGEGIETDIFFTFWGFDLVTERYMDDLKFTMTGNTAMHMPQAPGMPLPQLMGVLPGMTKFATNMMRKQLDDLEIPGVREMLDIIVASGGHLWGCKLSFDMNGLARTDLYDGVEDIISATDFIELSEGAQIIFV